MMKTIQVTLDETLLESIDEAVQEQASDRETFIRHALQWALRRQSLKQLEAQHAAGYARQPGDATSIDEWTDEQVWGDE